MARPITAVAAGSNRNRAILMLAVVFGLFSAMLVFAFLNSRDSGKQALEQAVNSAGAGAESVVVAAEDIKVGDTITDAKLKIQTIPVSALLPGRLTTTASAVDKVAVTPIFAGEQIIDAKISTYSGQKTLAFKIPDTAAKDMRALSLKVPHEAWIAAGLPQPGDRVDVLGITTLKRLDPLTGQERPDVVSGIIAENVEVLAISQTLVQSTPKTDSATSKASASGTPAASATAAAEARVLDTGSTFEKAVSITLAVPLEKAAKLALLDALDQNVAQYRILPRRAGNDALLTGKQLWSFDDIFPKK